MTISQLSTEQRQAAEAILNWLKNGGDKPFLLGGYAGTGKTTLMAIIRLILLKKKPKLSAAFASFTGKATRVLAKKLKDYNSLAKQDSVSTLHSLMYSPVFSSDGQISHWVRKAEIPYDLLFVDEASMISSEMWRDIQSLQLPILAVGDHGQLPPINSRQSILANANFYLEKIHRQAQDSPILKVAQLARETGKIPIQNFGAGVEKFNLQSSDSLMMIDSLFQSWQPENLFLTGFNHSRIKINQAIRDAQYRHPEKPEKGDKVVCLKNDWEKGIFNGMTGFIQSISPDPDSLADWPRWLATIVDEDSQVLYQGPVAAKQFNSLTTLPITKKQLASAGQLFDYGYALTVHKAQGSEAPKVVLIEERSKHMSDEDWRRWLYTAVTRAERELFIFGRPS